MRVIRGLAGLHVGRRLCLAMGVFDGVHLGHQAIIAEMMRMAAEGGVPAVLTFDPHPNAVLSADGPPPLLTTTEEKSGLLRALGVRLVLVARFTRAFASTPAQRFIERLVVGRLKACCVVVGEGWRFGAGGEGTAEMLHRAASEYGFRVKVVPAVKVGGRKVSSTGIRELLLRGRVAAARERLGRPYQVSGVVVPGAGRGRLLGFPTANLRVSAEKLIPADGVYASYALAEGPEVGAMSRRGPGSRRRWRPAVVSIGVRPTFERGGERRVEVHLLGRRPRGELLGRRLRVVLLERLRGERAFSSPEALAAQMAADCALAWDTLGALQAPL